jgi:hypothetical protein
MSEGTKKARQLPDRAFPNSEIGIRKSAFLLGCFEGADVDALPAAVEIDDAGLQGEERPIAAGPDVEAGGELGADLADENAAGGDGLPAELLDAAPLALAVAPVPG